MAGVSVNSKHVSDMTKGPILPIIVSFALPLMLGGLFQDLYSVADMAIAGYTLGDDALAAISATAAIVTLINYSSRGFVLGSSILVSNAFGAGDMDRTRKTVYEMLLLTALYTAVITTVGLIFAKPLMRLVSVPAEIFENSRRYLVIIIAGLFSTLFYNAYACAFKALGNSKMPLYFLIFCSIANIILDYVCIVFFDMGVAGAAFATVLSQLLSAVLSGFFFYRMFPEMRYRRGDLKEAGDALYDMFTVGFSVALTNSIFAIGAVAIQGALNRLGSETIIAQSACSKIQMFAVIPSINIANTVATFAAQNYGAKDYDRITKGIWISLALSFSINIATYLIIFVLGAGLIRLITNTKNENVVLMGRTMLRLQVPFIWAQTATMSFRMCLQSMKKKLVPMTGTAVELVIRCFFAFALTPIIGYRAISLAEPAAWIISGAAMAICYFIVVKKEKAAAEAIS